MKNVLPGLMLLLPCLFGFQNLFAQKNTINGRVTDALTGEPVKKMRVLLPTGTKKILTDDEGKFKAGFNKKIKFITLRKFGYDDIRAEAKEGTFDFTAKHPKHYFDSILGDISGEKKLLFSVFSGEMIFFDFGRSFESTLKAQTNTFFANAPEIGQAPFFAVRGVASIVPDGRSLTVLDGIFVQSEGLGQITGRQINPYTGFHTADFEEAYLSKGASAYYGARAANGVLSLRTKRGEAGKTRFEISYSLGVISPTARPAKGLSRQEYLRFWQEMYENRKKTDPSFSLSQEEAFAAVSPDWQTNNETDWSQSMYRSGMSQDLHLSAKGGKDKSIFYASVFYQNIKNAMLGNGRETAGFLFNGESRVSSKLNLGLTQRISFSNISRFAPDSSASNPLRAAYNAPFFGEKSAVSTIFVNPSAEIENGFLRNSVLRGTSKIFAHFEFSEKLKWRNEIGLEIFQVREDEFRGVKTSSGVLSSGYARNAVSAQNNLTVLSALDFHSKTSNGEVFASGGLSFQKVGNSGNALTGYGFAANGFTHASRAAVLAASEDLRFEYTYQSAFFTGSYTHAEKYVLRADMRYDVSSRAGENRFSGVYPQIGAAWLLSKEFADSSALLPVLKLRADFGISGNSNLYAYAARGLFGSNAYGNNFGIYPKLLANPELATERAAQINAGLDFAFLYGYIFGSFDYYKKTVGNLILPVLLAPSSGYDYMLVNEGSMNTTGFELSLNTKLPLGEIVWQSGFALTSNKSIAGNMNGRVIESGIYGFAENQAFASYYLPKFAGVDAKNGDALYARKDGGTTNDITKADKFFVGQALPNLWWRWSNELTFKNLKFEFSLDGASGHSVYDAGRAALYANPLPETFAGMWRKEGDVTSIPQMRWGVENGNAPSSRFLTDGAFVRLRSLGISYQFDDETARKMKLQKATLFARAENVLVFSGYKGGEILNDNPLNFAFGNASFAAPQMRIFQIGFKAGF